ncbi:hypothetical protein [Candidatus Protochlamydia phocaeensis]|uniref:hypothetical protein n=1 Tax=Candidatus Protochlamydia phocaeensis TaxID=1414722 RepID=UPI00083939B7|nr:hypothetical protein [Candidatus Protochlamydia phocaeensis]
MTSEILKNEQIDQVKLVKTAYIKSIIGSFVVVFVGLITSTIINQYFPLTPITINLLQAFSIVPGSAALFGVQGWNIQTWCGTTPAEILNQKIFRFLSIIGLFFAVVAFSLSSESTRETPNIENATSLTQT